MSYSHKQILRSSAIIGGASAVNVLLSLVRMKVAAVTIGAAGIGLLGLLQTFVTIAAVIAGLGVNGSATRQIALERGRGGSAGEALARRALARLTLVLAVIGGLLVFAFRAPIANVVLGDEGLTSTVGWLAAGVAASLVGGALVALLMGLRQISDVARSNVVAGLLATFVTVPALLWLGERAILIMVLATPVATMLAAWWYARRLPRPEYAASVQSGALMSQSRQLVRLGAAMMGGQIVLYGGGLAIRSLIGDRLGLDAVGHFQASWSIAMMYLTLVLQAMGTDYLPRLSAMADDPVATNRLVNEQTEVATLLSGPLIVALIGASPWVIGLLYSNDFAPAATVLRWQMLGDVLKIAGWPLGFVLLARGKGRQFLCLEMLVMALFLAFLVYFLPILGVEAAGVAYLAMYTLYLPSVYVLVRLGTGFRWTRKTAFDLSTLAGVAIAVFVFASVNAHWGLAAATIGAAVLTIHAFFRLRGHFLPPVGATAGPNEL